MDLINQVDRFNDVRGTWLGFDKAVAVVQKTLLSTCDDAIVWKL